tara:strand:- start:5964 stop:6821 length:858 start_codon:yes stop_codon:yes gene_type:complete
MKQITLILISILFSANILSLGLGSMKISSIAGEKFEAEITISNIQTNQIASTELIKTTKSFSKSEESIQIENLNIAIFSNDEKTAFKISSDKELDTKYFDFYLVLKLKNGNELKRRYFGILPDQRKSKAVYNERTPKEESFAVMDLGSCSELSNPGERLKCFDKTMGKKTNDQDYVLSQTSKMSQEEMESRYFGRKGKELEDSIERSVERSIPKVLGTVIKKVRKYNTDRYYLDLENGQTWKVIEPSRRKEFQAGKNVVIEKGRMGTFTVRIQGVNKKYSAKRVK